MHMQVPQACLFMSLLCVGAIHCTRIQTCNDLCMRTLIHTCVHTYTNAICTHTHTDMHALIREFQCLNTCFHAQIDKIYKIDFMIFYAVLKKICEKRKKGKMSGGPRKTLPWAT